MELGAREGVVGEVVSEELGRGAFFFETLDLEFLDFLLTPLRLWLRAALGGRCLRTATPVPSLSETSEELPSEGGGGALRFGALSFLAGGGGDDSRASSCTPAAERRGERRLCWACCQPRSLLEPLLPPLETLTTSTRGAGPARGACSRSATSELPPRATRMGAEFNMPLFGDLDLNLEPGFCTGFMIPWFTAVNGDLIKGEQLRCLNTAAMGFRCTPLRWTSQPLLPKGNWCVIAARPRS